MNTTQTHARTPWIAMLIAGVLLVSSFLAACRLTPERPAVRASHERSVERLASGPEIRVRMRRDVENAVIDAPGRLSLYAKGDHLPAWVGPGPLRLTRTASGFRASTLSDPIASPAVRVIAEGGVLTLGTGAEKVSLEGEVELIERSASGSSAFDVIESLPIERYLPGVLAKELYHQFAPEAYRAQAVAARSYALHERSRRTRLGSHFDVESTTMDQAYAGAATHPRAAEAVRATSGQILTWNGQTLRAYYSSTCGDRPASARDTWPITAGFEFNTADPIQARPRPCACAKSPRHRWTLERSASDASDRLRAWGANAGHAVRKMSALRSIDPAGRNAAGRPNQYRVSDVKGQRYTLSAEELRVALNTPAKGRDAITGATRVLSGDLHPALEGDTLRLRGRGFGHGVGLCQFGADGLARQGLGHTEILARYYPGARIERAY